VKGIGEPLLVAASLGLDGDSEHGWRERHRLQAIVVLVVGVVEDGIEM
jgi:hypothetical protein